MNPQADRDSRYIDHLTQLRAAVGDERRAMELAVGGEFDAVGRIELELLRYAGLEPRHSVVDVGCGSGRLALPLAQFLTGTYIGIDVVPDMVDYARGIVGRPDWRFEIASNFAIPDGDATADMVCFFSVFTHLLHEETFTYLKDAYRVLRPGGKVVFSFLEFRIEGHWPVFEATVNAMGAGTPHNQFLDQDAINRFADAIGFHVEEIRRGDDPFIPLEQPVVWENGARFESFAALGQSIAILTRPTAGSASAPASVSTSQAPSEPPPSSAASAGASSVLDSYVLTLPTNQNAVDIFRGEWASQFPSRFAVEAGTAALFEDGRITWLADTLGGLENKKVLELGPLEGGHSWMLANAGANVVAVEAQSRAYLKCLVAKEITGMANVQFLLGDFVEYLRSTTERFDVCVASGVLYHLRNPVEVLDLIAQASDTMMLWTHYFDEQRAETDPSFGAKVTGSREHESNGLRYTLHRYEYQAALEWAGFCGGSAPYAEWLSRADLFAVIEGLGWTVRDIAFDDSDHPNGPALALIASRGDAS